jgi:hypothetical protein
VSETNSVICVLGMHRSGTSLLSRMLNLLGVHLGSEGHLLARSASNASGYWEHQQFIRLNDEILRRLGGTWYALPRFPQGWEAAPEFDHLKREAVSSVLGDFAGADVWGWKDPRTCLTLPFWQRILPNMKYVIGLRNPADVASSLERRDGFSIEQGLYLWLVYLQAALRYTSDQPRIFVSYEDLLQGWRDQLPIISHFIGKPKQAEEPSVQNSVRESINRKLQHHCTPIMDERPDAEYIDSNNGSDIAQRIYLSLKRGNLEQVNQMLQKGIDILEGEVDRQKSEPQYRWLYEFHLTLQELDALIPAKDAFVLVSWYQWGADQIIAGRKAVPFLGRNGEYMGPPEDDQTAIRELERVRQSGVSFIVFGWPAFWWLEYYSQFHSYLRSNFLCVLENDRLVVFNLQPKGTS